MTAAELLDWWHLRDARYAASRYGLSDEAISAVRDWRVREVAAVRATSTARESLDAEARTWFPPQPRSR